MEWLSPGPPGPGVVGAWGVGPDNPPQQPLLLGGDVMTLQVLASQLHSCRPGSALAGVTHMSASLTTSSGVMPPTCRPPGLRGTGPEALVPSRHEPGVIDHRNLDRPDNLERTPHAEFAVRSVSAEHVSLRGMDRPTPRQRITPTPRHCGTRWRRCPDR